MGDPLLGELLPGEPLPTPLNILEGPPLLVSRRLGKKTGVGRFQVPLPAVVCGEGMTEERLQTVKKQNLDGAPP